MPYRLRGNVIYHKIDGHWKIKQRATSLRNAKASIKLLNFIEHEHSKRTI
jgi:hypothetical protein